MYRFAIVDIETAGFAPGEAPGITEIAILIYEEGKVIDRFEAILNPECRMNPYVEKLTGITEAMIADAPVFADVAEQIDAITEDCVFVAHSVNFDFSYIQQAFKTCGMKYERQKLCTVRLSRKLLPDQPSYSLGKLCAGLGIELQNRHRAMGDAAATVLLFEKCMENDQDNFIYKSLKRNSRETTLPPHLPKQVFDLLPEKTGVYYFHDEHGKVLYVGKAVNIKSRIAGHFTSRAAKLDFFTSIANITYTLCGTELIALLLEAAEIKKNFPPYNKAQKISNTVYVLASYTDKKGVQRLLISKNHRVLDPLMSFRSFATARSWISKLQKDYELCPKYCGIHSVNGACYDLEKAECKGVCAGIEPVEEYNKRVSAAIDYIAENNNSKLIIDNGRTDEERSVVVIEKGIYRGFGYFHKEVKIETVEEALSVIDLQKHTADVEQILAIHALN
jgi:DNA polymerase III subunit epsilon